MKTLEEIEYTVSRTLQANKTATFHFQQAEIGEGKVEIEKTNWYSFYKTEFQPKDKDFHFEFCKPDPFFCLFFQIKGTMQMISQQTSIMPEQHHSFNFLPCFAARNVVDKHTHLQNVSIKINPEILAAKLLEEDKYDENWQRIFEHKQPYVTLHTPKKMYPAIWDTLFQLLNCPYTGTVGQMYKDLLVRMLFIDQAMNFCQNGNKPAATPDNKLHNRDIDQLHAIKHYLEGHYLDDLSLDRIVKEFGLNTFKLKYGFKKLFGTSVMKFIDDKKMAYAKQLLQDRQTDVMDIAYQLGYNHYNNFSAAFKRKYGCSPAFFADKFSYASHR